MIAEKEEVFEIEAQPVRRGEDDAVLETPLDLHKWLNDPASKNKFIEINKDVPLSNLSDAEVWLSRNFADFALQLKKMRLTKAAEYFRFQLFFLLNVSLGKGGMARRLVSTSIMKYDIKKGDENKGFWKKKQKK